MKGLGFKVASREWIGTSKRLQVFIQKLHVKSYTIPESET